MQEEIQKESKEIRKVDYFLYEFSIFFAGSLSFHRDKTVKGTVFLIEATKNESRKKIGGSDSSNQIFLFAKTALKVFPQWSKSPIVSSVLLPLLSGLPAIFQDFLGVATSVPHLGHLAIRLPIHKLQMIDKTFSISNKRIIC